MSSHWTILPTVFLELSGMDEAEEFDPGLIITTRCLTGLALLFFLARVAVQAVKRCDIRWDSLTLVASWVSPFNADSDQGRTD